MGVIVEAIVVARTSCSLDRGDCSGDCAYQCVRRDADVVKSARTRSRTGFPPLLGDCWPHRTVIPPRPGVIVAGGCSAIAGPAGPIPPWPGVIVAGDCWRVAGPNGPIAPWPWVLQVVAGWSTAWRLPASPRPKSPKWPERRGVPSSRSSFGARAPTPSPRPPSRREARIDGKPVRPLILAVVMASPTCAAFSKPLRRAYGR